MARRPRILITAGPTREYIDPVRFLSNESSGRMGIALAEESLRRGLPTTFIHGPIAYNPPAGSVSHAVVSAEQMLQACRTVWAEHDLLIMAAAVADYRPAQVSGTKLKKNARELVLRLVPTTDILADLAVRRRLDQVVIGFALEDSDGRARAEDKLRRKNLDGIVLNDPSALGAERSQVELFAPARGWLTLPVAEKRQIAAAILDWALPQAWPVQRAAD